MISKLSCRG